MERENLDKILEAEQKTDKNAKNKQRNFNKEKSKKKYEFIQRSMVVRMFEDLKAQANESPEQIPEIKKELKNVINKIENFEERVHAKWGMKSEKTIQKLKKIQKELRLIKQEKKMMDD